MRLVAVLSLVCAAACSSSPPSLPAPPDADVVFSAQRASAVAPLLELSDVRPLFEPAPDAPVVAGLYRDGSIIVVTRARPSDVFKAISAAGAAPAPFLGGVHAAGEDTLVRVDKRGRVFAALHVPATRRAATAAVLEVLATDDKAAPADLPLEPAAIRVRVPVLGALGPLDVVVTKTDNEVRARAVASTPTPELVRAIAAPAPSWACALDDGALAVLDVPPLDVAGADEAFEGRVVVAVLPRAKDDVVVDGDLLSAVSVVVAGVPKAGAEDLLAPFAGRFVEERIGTRRTLSLPGERLRIVMDSGLFAVGLGAHAALDRVAPAQACPTTPRPMLRADVQGLMRALWPALLTREDVVRALISGNVDDALPAPWLRRVRTLEVTSRTAGTTIELDATVTFASN